MGTDINAHLEIKIDGEWHHWSCLYLDRCYAAFSKMADVRNIGDVEPISLPRGLPDDITLPTKIDADTHDGFAHSWLSHEELVELINFLEEDYPQIKSDRVGSWLVSLMELGTFIFGNSITGAYEYPEELPFLEDLRLVIWFD